MTGAGQNKRTEAIREMIDHRLKSISQAAADALPAHSHLDEDTISAFVEGRLGAGESKPVLAHLTSCGNCRRVSAQLLRLDEIEAESAPQTVEEEPGRMRAFLSHLASLVPSADEDVVFAYQNPPADDRREQPDAPKTESDEGKNTDKS